MTKLLCVLALACGAVILTTHDAHAAEAYSLNTAGMSYDEECLTYCLQGLVNRDAPRLFLDTADMYGPSDRYWMKYLAERKGFHFTPLPCLRDAIEKFRATVKGLVVYDPSEDATRYLALTLAAQRDLLPVTPALLKYETPALRGGTGWTEDDMSDPARWHAAGAKPEKSAQGLRIVQEDAKVAYGAVERAVDLDLARTPILEIDVAACTATWVLKVNDGTPVDTMLGKETSRTGVQRFDLRPLLKSGASRVMVRIFTVGEKSSVTVRRLRFLSAEGKPVAAKPEHDVDCFRGMKMVDDLRGRFHDDLAAYRWALKNLMPGCTKKIAFDAGHTHGTSWLGGDLTITLGLDYPIARKAFIFNLSPAAVPATSYGTKIPGYPDQAKMFDEVMARLDRPAGIFGWSEPEYLYCLRISESGNFAVCSAAPNMSFWAKVPAPQNVHLPAPRPLARPLENKYYVTFQTNEGDTPKILASLQSDQWLSPKRGTVPLAWGIDPYLAQVFPALFEYYATTAKPRDSFFAGCSGAGYTYPWHMPDLGAYARHVKRLIDAHGPNVVDVWESGLHLDEFAKYQRIVHVSCFTQQTIGPATNNWLADGTPVISAAKRLYYFGLGESKLDAKDPIGDLQRRIEAVAAAHEPPYFILCYGGLGYGALPHGLVDAVAQLEHRLPADKFEIVGMDDMAALARQAGQFTIAVDGLGVAPGGKVDMTISLRNPDGKAGAAGRVDWTLPAGWKASEAYWDHGPVARATTLTHHVTLTAAGEPGQALIVCRDLRTGAVRRAPLSVYAASQSIADFASGGWQETGAKLTIDHGAARIATSKPWSSIRKTMDIDYDRGPVIEIKVGSCGGLWGLKVNDGTLPVDIVLQSDTNVTGRHAYDLSRVVHWHGKHRTQIFLFAIQAGTSFTVDDMKLEYRR